MRSAWSGLVHELTKLRISGSPSAYKCVTAFTVHILTCCIERPFWVVLMKSNSCIIEKIRQNMESFESNTYILRQMLCFI